MAVAAAAGDSPDEFIGVTIAGRYRIISRLGAGGMGVAYRAWDERDGVPVVIKIPKKAFFEDPRFAERFFREMRLLQGLGHQHIAPITDVGEHDGLPFVVLRFLPGGSLSNRRLRDENGRPKPNPAGMLHLWLPAVAEALDYVHSQGVVHRDVKPANIFFDAFWGAYLGDFGIAKIVEESDAFDKEHTLTATHMGIGTQEYMSPEQYTPKAAVDGRADQYALGVTVYEMLAGVRPFTGATNNLIVEVLTHPVPSLQSYRQDLPSSLCDAVHRGLAKSPAERFPTCREFATAVLRDVPLMEDEPGVARLLCPKCANILKLPTEAAGRKGKCPRCQTAMKVADDLGSLWLLDEARRQRKVTKYAEQATESGTQPENVNVDEQALEDFKPVSDTRPIPKRPSPRKKTVPKEILIGLGVAVVGAVLFWGVKDLGGGGGKPKPPPTYEQQLVAAMALLKGNPTSPSGNEIVGKHLCFKEQDWRKGLPYLVRSRAYGLSTLAQREIDALNDKSGSAGKLIAVAREWWDFTKREESITGEWGPAIRKHAADLYLQHIASLESATDIEFANKWLDTDKTFSGAVGHKRPTEPQKPPAPDVVPPVPAVQRDLVFLTDINLKKKTAHRYGNKTDSNVGGRKYEYSIYVHPRIDSGQSLLEFGVDGTFSELRGAIGIIDDSKVIASPQTFYVLGDGKELWRSQPFKQTGRGEDFRVNVSGIKKLELLTESKGSRYGAHCVWIDPVLVRQGATHGNTSPEPERDTARINPNVTWPVDAIVSAETGHAYKVFKDSLSWADAKTRCEQLGGHLVTISSSTELAFVVNCIGRFGIQVDRRDGQPTAWQDKLWAGGTDQGTEGQWRWIDGTPWTFSAWVLNQPDSDGNFLNLCPHIAGMWNDEGTAGGPMPPHMAGFICEWEPWLKQMPIAERTTEQGTTNLSRPRGELSDAVDGTQTYAASVSKGNASAIAAADKLSAGESHAFVCLPNGRVVGWGQNDFGTLDIPAGLSNAVAVAAGWKHVIALTRDGTVVAWGGNEWGQCDVPAGLSDVQSVRAAGGHSLALKKDGTVVAWGRMLRINRNAAEETPKHLGPCSAISAGFAHNLAVKQNGSVVAWGEATDYEGPLKTGDVRSVFAESNCGIHCNSLITKEGKVLFWGNAAGIRSGFMAGLEPPPLPEDTKAVWAGLDAVPGTGGGAILTEDGELICWPFDSEAMTSGGRAVPSPGRSPYTAANGASEIVAVNIGPGQVVALTRDYKIRIWGGGRLRNVPPELN